MEVSTAQWNRIRELFGDASHITASMSRSVPYCAIATANENGSPRVTPISSLILGEHDAEPGTRSESLHLGGEQFDFILDKVSHVG